MEKMTIAELYFWAVDKGVAEYTINIQYRDDGGDYYGKDEEVILEINEVDEIVTL